MKVGDLVVATFEALQPTGWYKQLFESQEPAIVVNMGGEGQTTYIEIDYRGANRNSPATNLKIVSKYELSSR